jgi:urease accessory protein
MTAPGMVERPGVGSSAEATGGAGEWLVWQLVDSAFPTGGFAHSSGLEAAWQQGEIEGRRGLGEYLEANLRQAGSSSLPLVMSAHRNPGELAVLDAWSDAWLGNHVANRASRLQGRALWTAAERAFLRDLGPAPEPGHLAPVFGVLMARLGLDADRTASLFLFQQLRSTLSAAVRLGIVGPLEAQTTQHRLGVLGQSIARRYRDAEVSDLTQTAPLLDLWQGAQDRLYSRLFQS